MTPDRPQSMQRKLRILRYLDAALSLDRASLEP
jgi:hypothetical protein